MKTILRDEKTGKILPKYKQWSLNNFNEGYVDIDGRMKVILKGHHRAGPTGQIFRSIVAYEAYHNELVTLEYDIHHKDGNKLNDSEENLEKILHKEHGKLHNPKGVIRAENKHLRKGKYLICPVCNQEFYRP